MSIATNNKVCLGDLGYAQFDGFGIVLITEDGLGPTNTYYAETRICPFKNLNHID
jgi:hypothetical protein